MNRPDNSPASKPTAARWGWFPILVAGALSAGVGVLVVQLQNGPAAQADEKNGKRADKGLPAPDPVGEQGNRAPELEGGIAWLNTGSPLKLQDLRGKIVLLDFWTLCCINCIHTLPDLAKLEKKYANELVVIGVHSPKFDNEKDTNSIRKAILRYEIQHPVVNDADMKIWRRYEVRSWPTLALIDPEGNYVGQASGEGNYEALDRIITKLIDKHRKNKTLDEKPVRFDTAKFREKADTPLYFPGKVLADAKGKRLIIADSTHHRIVITDFDGNKLAVAGTGLPGRTDGLFTQAQFDDPQGLALDGDALYVADRRNHLIRLIDLRGQTVRTVAGTGQQDRDRTEGGPALERGLNSPWDLYLEEGTLFIAMAGHHQIWTLDLKAGRLDLYAGNGRENIKDGPLFAANFAQPSGLAADDKYLYVADCEVSAIRRVPKNGKGRVDTIVGTGLFDFGDADGNGDAVRLQHAQGVAVHGDGRLLVADSYNDALKWIDPATRSATTWLRGFDEPGGVAIGDGVVYVADTNAHRIAVADLATASLVPLELLWARDGAVRFTRSETASG